MRPRSRYTPARNKRIAKAKFELETGEKFNPRKHEYDHEVPFSRGGSHTTDNIRVVDKKLNRSKGNRTPWWDVLGKL
jgi:CRISPR/Cas system Type II protein with McrA/HNH and RuvC-like nuclease domain